ncbi:high-potential iron-sulfur protein [Roseovarius tibetensis]|uniref:high-potential iron-sulfur protein n=1 Tax=Roseovarius tibetensis TaxID=2685897 RepID=UPI003D7F6AF0
MSNKFETARRAFLTKIAAFGAAVPFAGLGITAAGPAFAQEQAADGHALDYVNDFNDATDHARYRDGSQCSNCVFWQGGDDEWGGCQHPQFRDVLVNSNGWCSAYAPGG